MRRPQRQKVKRPKVRRRYRAALAVVPDGQVWVTRVEVGPDRYGTLTVGPDTLVAAAGDEVFMPAEEAARFHVPAAVAKTIPWGNEPMEAVASDPDAFEV